MLFSDTLKFNEYCPVNRNMAFPTLVPFIKLVEFNYLTDMLGAPLVAALNAEAATPTNTPITALLEVVRYAAAWLTKMEALPSLLSQLSDMGLTEQSSANNTATPSRQWVYNEQLEQSQKMADIFTEQMLSYLLANKSRFASWTNSSAYADFTECLIQSPENFQRYYPINSSRKTWKALRPFMLQVEEEYILPLLGDTLYTAMKTATSGDNYKLADKAKRVVSLLTIFEAMPHLNVEVTGTGIIFYSFGDGNKNRNTASEKAFTIARQALELKGQIAYSNLQEWLDQNASLFTDYTPTKKGEELYERPTNVRKSGSFMV